MTHNSNPKHVKESLIDFTAGSLGGIALVYVGQPLDTIKVKMQTFPTLYSNMVDCFVKTMKSDGIARGLYAGTVPALVTNIAENSVLFMFYGVCQRAIQHAIGAPSVQDLSVMSNASAGFLASFFSSLAITPTELIKCRLQAMHEIRKQEALKGIILEDTGPMKLTSQIFKTEGVPGLFRGLVPTIVREMPGYFLFFGGYEGCRELLREPGQTKDDIGLFNTMVAGSVGGAIFWISTFPIDVAKSRIQISNTKEKLIRTILTISRNEGISALYNGLTPTLVRTVPATAVLFATYEYSKKAMNYLAKDL